MAGAKPAASVDPWAAPAGSAQNEVYSNDNCREEQQSIESPSIAGKLALYVGSMVTFCKSLCYAFNLVIV